MGNFSPGAVHIYLSGNAQTIFVFLCACWPPLTAFTNLVSNRPGMMGSPQLSTQVRDLKGRWTFGEEQGQGMT